MACYDSYWSSGETCEVVGKYYSRCCCGEMNNKFVVGDIFPACQHCEKKLKWRRSLAGMLPIDTVETGAKSGSKKPKPFVFPKKRK